VLKPARGVGAMVEGELAIVAGDEYLFGSIYYRVRS